MVQLSRMYEGSGGRSNPRGLTLPKPAPKPATRPAVRASHPAPKSKIVGKPKSYTTKPANKVVVHVTPKPVLPGHEAGPAQVLPSHTATHSIVSGGTSGSGRWGSDPTPAKTVINAKHTGVAVTPAPAIPGHEHAATSTIAATSATKHKPTTHASPKPKPKPKGGPVATKPAPAAKPKPKPSGTTATSSPAPQGGSTLGQAGGFDLGSLLPMLLIAGAVIAGVYLYTHRKG